MIVSSDISPEELKVFLEEADENIQVLNEDLIKLEKDGQNPEILQRIFRAAHTLKGSSSTLGHKRMTDVTHAMESLLDKLRNKKLDVSSKVIDSLLFGLDTLKVLKDEVAANKESGIDISTVVTQLTQVIEQSNSPKKNGKNGGRQLPATRDSRGEELKLNAKEAKKVREALGNGLNVFKIAVRIAEQSEWKAARCLQVLTDMRAVGDVITSEPSSRDIEQEKAGSKLLILLCTSQAEDKLVQLIKSMADIVDVRVSGFNVVTAGLPGGSSMIGRRIEGENSADGMTRSEIKNAISSAKSGSLQSIRVDVKTLDTLINMVEELVIDRARISQVGKMLENRYPEDNLVNDLADTSNHIIKVINELHQDIMKVRMMPVSLIFNKLPRLVRDLAQKQQKNVEFIIRGLDTELDRTILEQIHDPLIHLLRNAVDHGIETPEERIAAGKQAKATLKLSAFQEEGHIIITLEDNGRGINPDRVREAAVRKGFLAPELAEKLHDSEAIDLIFSAGMSTASTITDVSGRGVGLDIVRTNIERLNGTISLNTKPNKGTTFVVKLPLTVAVFQGLMVSVSDATYIMPLVSVVETIRISRRDIKIVLGQEVMRLRDSIIPLVRLGFVLGFNDHPAELSAEQYVIIVKAGDRLSGIVVDRLMDQQEFVKKSLGKHLGDIKGIAGATILSDGNVALILDVPTLISMVTQKGQPALTAKNRNKLNINSSYMRSNY